MCGERTMIQWRTTLGVVVVALALPATLRADLMPASPHDTQDPQSSRVCLVRDRQDTCPSDVLGHTAIVDEVQALLVRYAPDWEDTVRPAGERPPTQILSDRQGSLSLCIYALIGLGLFRSAPLVKKLSFGGIPAWYDDGGPRQVGHSFAIAPDCLCAAPLCFVQPPDAMAEKVRRYHFARVIALWRKSQFAAAVLASRAPPSLS